MNNIPALFVGTRSKVMMIGNIIKHAKIAITVSSNDTVRAAFGIDSFLFI